MKKSIKTILGIAACLAVAITAHATVTFDPTCSLTPSNSSGTCGFVGKGDVQLAFSWNNQTAQAQVNNVSFSFNSSVSYDVTIEFSTGNPDQPKSIQHQIVTQNKSQSVSATVASGPRQSPSQYTGWYLTGVGDVVISGDTVPNVGDSCHNGDFNDCVVTAVTPVSSSGGLFVSDTTLGLGPKQIWPTL